MKRNSRNLRVSTRSTTRLQQTPSQSLRQLGASQGWKDPFKGVEIPQPQLLPVEESPIDIEEERSRQIIQNKLKREKEELQSRKSKEELQKSIERHFLELKGPNGLPGVTYDDKGKVILVPSASLMSPNNGSIVTKVKMATKRPAVIEDQIKYRNVRFRKDDQENGKNQKEELLDDEIQEPLIVRRNQLKRSREANEREESLFKMMSLAPGVSMKQGNRIFLNPLVHSADWIPIHSSVGGFNITKKQYDEITRPAEPKTAPINKEEHSHHAGNHERMERGNDDNGGRNKEGKRDREALKGTGARREEPVSRSTALRDTALDVISNFQRIERERIENSLELAEIRKKNYSLSALPNPQRQRVSGSTGKQLQHSESIEKPQITFQSEKILGELLELDTRVQPHPEMGEASLLPHLSRNQGRFAQKPSKQVEISLSQLDAFNMQLLSGHSPMTHIDYSAKNPTTTHIPIIPNQLRIIKEKNKRGKSNHFFMTETDPTPPPIGNPITHHSPIDFG